MGNFGCESLFDAKRQKKGAQIPWEKSMLSRWAFQMVDSPDCGHYFFGNVDGVGCLV